MKILIAHNEYKYRGGEDTVVDAESALLRTYSHDVQLYRRNNNELDSTSRMNAAVSAIWSNSTANDIDRICKTFRPDLIHVHNTFPVISPSIYWVAEKNNVPVVQTLHNFRLLCPQAMFLRDGKPCEQCLAKTPWPAVLHKCYRGSAVQSTVAVTMLSLHRTLGTYQNKVTLYIALNEFGRNKFIEAGFPAEAIRIKPNFVESTQTPVFSDRHGGLFVGRLSEEKGLKVLSEAVHQLAGVRIRIIGNGPLEKKVQQIFGDDYIGEKSNTEISEMLRSARYLVVPSIATESFGMVVIEAFSCGTPAIASDHGGLSDLVSDGVTGLLFNPSDANDLAKKIAWAESHPEQMMKMGRAARAEYERRYTSERNYAMLMDIYEQAIFKSAQARLH